MTTTAMTMAKTTLPVKEDSCEGGGVPCQVQLLQGGSHLDKAFHF